MSYIGTCSFQLAIQRVIQNVCGTYIIRYARCENQIVSYKLLDGGTIYDMVKLVNASSKLGLLKMYTGRAAVDRHTFFAASALSIRTPIINTKKMYYKYTQSIFEIAGPAIIKKSWVWVVYLNSKIRKLYIYRRCSAGFR